LCFTIVKAHGPEWGTFPKCREGLSYHLILGLLFLKSPHPKSLPYTLKLGPKILLKKISQIYSKKTKFQTFPSFPVRKKINFVETNHGSWVLGEILTSCRESWGQE
jgi:hypothetical protein